MKKIMKKALLSALLVSSCVNFCYAEDAQTTTAIKESGINKGAISPIENVSNISGVKSEGSKVELSKQLTPVLVTPIVKVPEPKEQKNLKQTSKPIDLKAIIFDPNAKFNAQAIEENREMTKTEKAEYNLHEALHGSVSVPSTKGLLEDKMKMTFDKGPIESISPWFDFNGAFSNIWTGDNYANTLYGINFCDVGINGKMRDQKTTFRVMLNYGKEIVGNTYMQSLPADIYVIRQLDKHNKVFLGYARSPIGMEGGETPLTIPFFTRSQISRTFGNVRTLGTKFMGDYDFIDYNVGFSSSGRYFRDFFPGPEFTGWVNLKPLAKTGGKYGKLTLGGGLNAGNAESHYAVTSTYVNYEYKRLKATAEYASSDGSNGSTGFTPNRAEGYYGTLAYRISPKLQALVRYDKFDPNTEKSNDMRTEYTAGINYFIKGQALKLMLNYVYYTLENGNAGNKIMVGTQIIL